MQLGLHYIKPAGRWVRIPARGAIFTPRSCSSVLEQQEKSILAIPCRYICFRDKENPLRWAIFDILFYAKNGIKLGGS